MCSRHLQLDRQLPHCCSGLSSRQPLLRQAQARVAQLAQQQQLRQRPRHTCRLHSLSCRQWLTCQLCSRRPLQLLDWPWRLRLLVMLALLPLLLLQAAMLVQPICSTSIIHSRRATLRSRRRLRCSLQVACGPRTTSSSKPQVFLAWQRHGRACQLQLARNSRSRLLALPHRVVACQAWRCHLQPATPGSSSTSSKLATGAVV